MTVGIYGFFSKARFKIIRIFLLTTEKERERERDRGKGEGRERNGGSIHYRINLGGNLDFT